MNNLDDLERLAKAATPGPWEYREHDGSAAVCNADGWVEAILPSGAQENADAAYCAAANPAAIADLIAEVRALRTRLEIDPRHSYDGIDCRDETIRQLEGEVRALREAQVPSGFVPVPVEPTDEILYAGYGYHYRLETTLGKKKAREDYAELIQVARGDK